MNEFLLSEMFRLEIRWESVSYTQDGICTFKNAYFTGPVLQVAQRLNDKDKMLLDFYSQYIKLVKGTYVGKFSWEGVNYSEDGKKAYFNLATLEHSSELNNVPTLNSDDYFIVDASDHTSDKHENNLVYKTYLINADSTVYRFDK